MAWLYLIVAGFLEIAFALGLKFSAGFTRLGPTLFTAVTAVASFVFLSLSLRSIPIGTGYAVWTGIGAAGTAVLGMIFLGDSREPIRVACIALIVLAVIGLKVSSQEL